MFGSVFIWGAATICFAAVFVWKSVTVRPSIAIGIAVLLSMLPPVWSQLHLFSSPAGTTVGAGPDVKVTVGAGALLLYAFMRGATFPIKLSACDLAMLGLLLTHFVSDFGNDGFSWNVLFRCWAEWYVPYVAGRLALQEIGDLDKIWKWACAVSVVLGLLAIFEALSGVNPFELVAGVRPLEQTPREAFRWGVRRAYGPCLNPIYFGVLQLILLLWSTYGARQALIRQASSFWVLTPAIAGLGVFATGSRGPVLGLVGFMFFLLFAMVPKMRVLLACGLAATLTGAIFERERVLSLLEQWSGESRRVGDSQVTIDDDQKKFSGTRSRLLMLDVYSIAFRRAGLWGFGTEATTGFPVRVPLGDREADTLRRIKFVDNAYALLLLRFGYAGLITFLLACSLAVVQFAKLANHPNYDIAFMGICGASALLATFVVMMTVWMPHDYGFALLWSLGISSGLTVADRYDKL